MAATVAPPGCGINEGTGGCGTDPSAVEARAPRATVGGGGMRHLQVRTTSVTPRHTAVTPAPALDAPNAPGSDALIVLVGHRPRGPPLAACRRAAAHAVGLGRLAGNDVRRLLFGAVQRLVGIALAGLVRAVLLALGHREAALALVRVVMAPVLLSFGHATGLPGHETAETPRPTPAPRPTSTRS